MSLEAISRPETGPHEDLTSVPATGQSPSPPSSSSPEPAATVTVHDDSSTTPVSSESSVTHGVADDSPISTTDPPNSTNSTTLPPANLTSSPGTSSEAQTISQKAAGASKEVDELPTSASSSPNIVPNSSEANVAADSSTSPVVPSLDSSGPSSPKSLVPKSAQTSSPGKKGKKKRVGPPGNFDGPREEFLQEKLKVYKKIPKCSKARTIFFRETYVEFIEKFPPEKYPIPGYKQPPPLPEKTEADILAMTADERKTWKRKVRLRSRNEDDRLRDMMTSWFQWHGGDVRGTGKVSVGKFLASVKTKEKAPKKPSLAQALIKHPQHRLNVIEKSEETDSTNRLVSRNKAAQDVLKEMPEEEKTALAQELNAKHQKRMAEWKASQQAGDEDEKLQYQRSIGRIVQPLLDELQVRTGLNFALLAGVDADGKGHFDSAIYSSQPEGTKKLLEFCPEKLEDFMGFYYLWLHHLAQSQATETTVESQLDSVRGPSTDGRKVQKGKSQKGKKARGRREAVTDESETESNDETPSEDSTSSGPEDDLPKDGKDMQGMVEDGECEDEDGDGDEDEDEEGEESVKPSSSTKGLKLSQYEQERAENIARNKMLLKNLGLDKPFIESKQKRGKKAQKTAKRAVQPERLRRSTRKRTEVATYAETAPQTEDLPDTNPNPDSEVPDKAQTLLDARTRFMNTGMETREFVELIEKTLPRDSVEFQEWVQHTSVLGEWLVTGDGDCPMEPSTSSAIYQNLRSNKVSPTLSPIHGTQTSPTNPSADDGNAPEDCRPSEPALASVPVTVTVTTQATDVDMTQDLQRPVASAEALISTPETPSSIQTAVSSCKPIGDTANDTADMLSTPLAGGADSTAMDMMPALNSPMPSTHMGAKDLNTGEAGSPAVDELGVTRHVSARSSTVVEAYERVTIRKMRKYAPAGASSSLITDMITYLRTDLGPEYPARPEEWDSVVYLWADLQETYAKLDYKAGRLPTATRPDALTWWMRQGRLRGNGSPPPSCVLEKIRLEFWVWWSDINPESRGRCDGYVLPDLEDDFEDMHKRSPGKDGIVLVLVLLRWWFDLSGEKDEHGMCMEALKSVGCTMEKLLKDLCSSAVSDSDEDEESGAEQVSQAKRRKPGKGRRTQVKKPRHA
ncbi:hypothetical protein VNI00_018678 [Paramarasmius palmivorus]|uniref:Uncharacterized protein n=1 Tax=Paramarasmius palmivorus TaxID=297713 RepID=A0AAW0AV13_9AGAR